MIATSSFVTTSLRRCGLSIQWSCRIGGRPAQPTRSNGHCSGLRSQGRNVIGARRTARQRDINPAGAALKGRHGGGRSSRRRRLPNRIAAIANWTSTTCSGRALVTVGGVLFRRADPASLFMLPHPPRHSGSGSVQGARVSAHVVRSEPQRCQQRGLARLEPDRLHDMARLRVCGCQHHLARPRAATRRACCSP